ncbi:Hypothetical predicted protein [Podarcis lilfordi]|uniref:Uncharacterized protein n=1 Tax=Podarcis lilfordi TaxID=74358 RepID=A0AA35PRF8_9SAUR|nr:Hypothetical predicted protein [Podarcis lilfordi]
MRIMVEGSGSRKTAAMRPTAGVAAPMASSGTDGPTHPPHPKEKRGKKAANAKKKPLPAAPKAAMRPTAGAPAALSGLARRPHGKQQPKRGLTPPPQHHCR